MSDSPPLERDELNMAEKFYLEEHCAESVEKLAEALKRSVAQVQFELNLIEQKKFEQESAPLPNPQIPVKESEVTTCVKESPLLKSFARRKEGGVVVMNAAAAQMSDEISKAQRQKSVLQTRPDCVTRVRK